MAATIFAIDLLLPLGVAGGVPYVALVLLGIWFSKVRHIYILAVIGSVLTGIGYFASPPGGIYWIVLFNRGLALFAIWITAFLISAHKLKAAELRKSDERFHRVFDMPLMAMGIYAAEDKKWIEINQRMCELFGYSREEMFALSWTELTHPDDLNANLSLFNTTMTDPAKNSYSQQKRFISRDGKVIHAIVQIECIRSSDGKPDYFIIHIEDITKRKEIEAKLRESEETLAMAIENVPGGFLMVDKDDCIALYNSKFILMYPELQDCILCGASFENLIRTGAQRGIYPDAQGNVEEWIETRMKKLNEKEISFEEQLSKGRWISVALKKMPDGTRVGIHVDITNLK